MECKSGRSGNPGPMPTANPLTAIFPTGRSVTAGNTAFFVESGHADWIRLLRRGGDRSEELPVAGGHLLRHGDEAADTIGPGPGGFATRLRDLLLL